MSHWFGVYGLDFSREIRLGGIHLFPASGSASKAEQLARSKERFNLTGIGSLAASDCGAGQQIREKLFDLEAVMTLAEQQWVALSRPLMQRQGESPNEAMSRFPDELLIGAERPTSGALVLPDQLDSSMKRDLIALCLKRLSDGQFCEQTGLRRAFFRHVETWRLHTQVIDLTYYLNFSALETLARTWTRDFEGPVAGILHKFLRNLGFNVFQEAPSDPIRSIQDYAHLRNTLFHSSGMKKILKGSRGGEVLEITDYADALDRLVPDALLRVVGYEHALINWDRWFDRQYFAA